MKRSTAIRHLVELADAASEGSQLRSTEFGWPLEELWVSGTLFDPIDELDHGQSPPAEYADKWRYERGQPNLP